jgi:L-xylulokinase
MTDALLGIDIGQTGTKAVVFDLLGRELGAAIDSTAAEHPHPFWAERELESSWLRTASTVRTALDSAGVDAGVTVVGVGVSGHSDGLYLLDEEGVAVRLAILATDARARRQAVKLGSGTCGRRLLDLTGQLPMAASPSAIISWLGDHEPDALERSRWLVSSTDWLRLKLTGTAVTDLTTAAASFVALGSTVWSPEALALCDLDDVISKLPPIQDSAAIAGRITTQAARETGLAAGTPVVTGAHDVDTGALGMGAVTTGSVSVLLGTYAINQVLGDAPVTDPRWQTRPFLGADRWLHMSTSPAGAGCLDWVAARIGPHGRGGGPDCAAAVAEGLSVGPWGQPYFLPFVHGGPAGHPVGGSWLGVRSEHDRASLLYAVMEGVVFSHRSHIESLGSRMALPDPVRVGGGGSRSSGWTQMLSDSLGRAVEVTKSQEVSALGAALLAGVGLGVYDSLAEAVGSTVRVARSHEPNAARRAESSLRYERYTQAIRALQRLDFDPGAQVRRDPSPAG